MELCQKLNKIDPNVFFPCRCSRWGIKYSTVIDTIRKMSLHVLLKYTKGQRSLATFSRFPVHDDAQEAAFVCLFTCSRVCTYVIRL